MPEALIKEVSDVGKALERLAEAHRGHVEFCTEDRKREAESRQRIESQIAQLIGQITDIDGRRRDGIQRLHDLREQDAKVNATAIAEFQTENARWRLKMAGWALAGCVMVISGMSGAMAWVANKHIIVVDAPTALTEPTP